MHITDFPLEHGFLMKGFKAWFKFYITNEEVVPNPNCLGFFFDFWCRFIKKTEFTEISCMQAVTSAKSCPQ